MRRSIAVAVCLAALVHAVPGNAQDGSAPEGRSAAVASADDVRRAWSAAQTAQTDVRAALQARDAAKAKQLRATADAAERKFADAFATADWDAFDPSKEEELLGKGLLLAGADATSRGDAATAVRAYGAYVAKLPKGDAAAMVEGVHLPGAHVAAGDVRLARPLLEKHAQSLFGQVQSAALVLLGDVQAATESTDRARETWSQVANVTAPSSGRDVFMRAKSDAALRLAVVGSAAPEIDTQAWIGAAAKPLSRLKGSVVLLDFWATWCAPCRRTARRMDALQAAKSASGLVVLGVTRFFDYGFVPSAGAADLVESGERFAQMSPTDFHDHLQQFRSNASLGYAFVTATAADFKAYGVQDLPTRVVVDRQGKVAFVQVGTAETLLALAIDRALAAPAAPASSDPRPQPK